jgi:CubicO group peptidase (beta-lactamase class C family)
MSDTDALSARVDEIVARHEVVGLAVGQVGAGGSFHFRGHGLADAATGRPITEETVFRIASITKTFTAIAVMQLVEQGLVDLDAPANSYLRTLRLVPADPSHRPATVRHLLSHSAGLGELAHLSGLVRPDFGESVPAGDPLPTVVEFYGGRIQQRGEPGTSFTYGNHSPAVLGQLVEDVTGTTLRHVFRERIFEPLAMGCSDLERSPRMRAALATGYDVGRRGVSPVQERDMVTTGAASVYSTTADMARYVTALLGGGANEHGRVLSPESLELMYQPAYQPDPRLPGMGLGFFRAEIGGRRVVQHQGVHPGFHSHLCLAPDDGVGIVVFTNGARDPMFWLSTEADGLLAAALGTGPAALPEDRPLRPARTAELAGWYRLEGPWSDLRKRVFMGAGAEVFVRDGRPAFRFLTVIPDLYRGYPLRPDDVADPDIYRLDLGDAGTSRVAFERDGDGSITAMVLEMMPLRLRRQPAWTNPRLWVWSLLGLVVVGAAAVGARFVRSLLAVRGSDPARARSPGPPSQ